MNKTEDTQIWRSTKCLFL